MAGSELLHKTLEILEKGPMNGEAVMGISSMIEARADQPGNDLIFAVYCELQAVTP